MKQNIYILTKKEVSLESGIDSVTVRVFKNREKAEEQFNIEMEEAKENLEHMEEEEYTVEKTKKQYIRYEKGSAIIEEIEILLEESNLEEEKEIEEKEIEEEEEKG